MTDKWSRRRFAAMLLAMLTFACMLAGCASTDKPEQVTTPTDTVVTEEESVFWLGADISTMIAQENSSVTYYDFNGNEADMLTVLRSVGINAVRVRVWNDPYNAEGQCYGAGICDIDTAVEIGKRAAALDMDVTIDFHYSDFWADPGKQRAPKAWEDMDIDAKAQALYDYTYECLGKLGDAGVRVSLVQVGNETNGAFCGETDWANICRLLKAGCDAVGDYDDSILRAVHFANPEKKNHLKFADTLAKHGVEYEVFASSYYAFWHGTLDNLVDQLSQVAEKYDKKVLIAETAWAYTYDEGDGQQNVVYEGREWLDVSSYPISVEGQKQAIIDVIETALNMKDICLGVFYWEPAWIPVNNITGLTGEEYDTAIAKNHYAWNTYGSGWANEAAEEFDHSAVDNWGGSEWECLALFDFDGHPLDSLTAFYGYSVVLENDSDQQ